MIGSRLHLHNDKAGAKVDDVQAVSHLARTIPDVVGVRVAQLAVAVVTPTLKEHMAAIHSQIEQHTTHEFEHTHTFMSPSVEITHAE